MDVEGLRFHRGAVAAAPDRRPTRVADDPARPVGGHGAAHRAPAEKPFLHPAGDPSGVADAVGARRCDCRLNQIEILDRALQGAEETGVDVRGARSVDAQPGDGVAGPVEAAPEGPGAEQRPEPLAAVVEGAARFEVRPGELQIVDEDEVGVGVAAHHVELGLGRDLVRSRVAAVTAGEALGGGRGAEGDVGLHLLVAGLALDHDAYAGGTGGAVGERVHIGPGVGIRLGAEDGVVSFVEVVVPALGRIPGQVQRRAV